MKDHLENILKLNVGRTNFIVREEARFRIGEIVTSCGYDITPFELFNIENKEEFMVEFIEDEY